MKTTSDIIDKLYAGINVTAVKTAITGSVYRHKKPVNSKLQDIVIGCQPVSNEENAVTQTATAVINCFAKNFTNGLPDETKLKSISAAVISAIEAITITGGVYFNPQILSHTIMQDYDDPEMSYANIRVMCSIEA